MEEDGAGKEEARMVRIWFAEMLWIQYLRYIATAARGMDGQIDEFGKKLWYILDDIWGDAKGKNYSK